MNEPQIRQATGFRRYALRNDLRPVPAGPGGPGIEKVQVGRSPYLYVAVVLIAVGLLTSTASLTFARVLFGLALVAVAVDVVKFARFLIRRDSGWSAKVTRVWEALGAIRDRGEEPAPLGTIAAAADVDHYTAKEILDDLVGEGSARTVGDRYVIAEREG